MVPPVLPHDNILQRRSRFDALSLTNMASTGSLARSFLHHASPDRTYLTPLTYALYYFIFAQITTYTLKAYFTLGAIPPSTTAFLESWKRGLRTKRERKVLRTFRAQGMDMNGFCRLRKSQLPLMVHIGVNLIILFLEI
jgi:hypothetical protein